MRIIAGDWRGRVLRAPVGDATRPTADRTREALFSMLASRLGNFEELRVADLFAGTGALGLEALSRGAAQATFVDDGTAARALLRRNIELTRTGGVTDVWRRDATKMGANKGDRFGLVFLDPPYGKSLGEAAVASLLSGGWLAPDALVVWEEGTAPLPPAGFDTVDQRRYGDTHVTLLRAIA